MAGFTPEDDLLIEAYFNDLLKSCQKICQKEGEMELIKKAFFLANEAHRGVRRRSGEPYILHPIAVAKIVVDEVGLGVKSVVSALLHDVVEDTSYTLEDIENLFGPKVERLVDGLSNLAGVFNDHASK
ncbi:MAG: bifunctional (p)ppGpp synthetase/guanosine-3',5'-bis(diphosphate) 3'-pyrophosphohydrolase, partial [Tidjanibacter sp.]|nr:bifunctional (p)ppGpp synthetase/guanosine-3',5'-bis(diphosphate) 3'-pyrophosphohydrolase [Tidjanibacter sp.]